MDAGDTTAGGGAVGTATLPGLVGQNANPINAATTMNAPTPIQMILFTGFSSPHKQFSYYNSTSFSFLPCNLMVLKSTRTNDESDEDIIRRINLLPSNLRNQAYLHLEFLEHRNNPAKEKEASKASDCE